MKKECQLYKPLMYGLLVVIVALSLWTISNKNKNKLQDQLLNKDNDKLDSVEKFINPSYTIKKAFKNYSNHNKVVLKGQCKQEYYTNDILSEKDRNLIQNIVNYILADVSKQLDNRVNINNDGVYNFKEINKVLIESNLLGKRYIVDTFIYDIKNYYSIRILLDFVVIRKDVYVNYVGLYEGSNNNVMNRFDSISGAGVGILYSTDQFQENWVTLFNKSYAGFKLFGVDGTTLESSDLDPETNNLHKLGINSLGKMILPTYVDNDKTVKPYSDEFCKKQKVNWDWTSANIPKIVPPNCALHNSATIAQANIPYYSPSIFDETQTYNNKKSNNSWLFRPERGNINTGF